MINARSSTTGKSEYKYTNNHIHKISGELEIYSQRTD